MLGTEEKWQAAIQNDESYDGIFYYAVRTTGIFCRPSCKSRTPKRENVVFFENPTEALLAGFRPCKRCRPDLFVYAPIEEMAKKAKELIDEGFTQEEWLTKKLSGLGITRHRLVEIFKEAYGQTVKEYILAARLAKAKALLLATQEDIAKIAYDVGFGSLSSFYRIFKIQEHTSPSNYRKQKRAEDMP